MTRGGGAVAGAATFVLSLLLAGFLVEGLTREVRSRRAARVLVTHFEAAAATADRVLRLDHGKLVPL